MFKDPRSHGTNEIDKITEWVHVEEIAIGKKMRDTSVYLDPCLAANS